MPINKYGVWVAKPIRVSAERAEQDPRSPHIHLFYQNEVDSGEEFRASINVKSLSEISELVFWLVLDFQHPIVNQLRGLKRGFQQIPSQPGGVALDYIRGNLMDFDRGRILPHDLPDERDDIIDYVMPELQAAINRNAMVYLFGEPYDDMKGIHNIHMNQGSAGRFASSNGVWQDGGIIIYFPDENRFAAIWLAFASQAVHTDEQTGNALSGSQNFAQLLGGDGTQEPEVEKEKITDNRRVAIMAALVNPVGSENQGNENVEPEAVYLLNRSLEDISLRGWSLLNIKDEAQTISDDTILASGETLQIAVDRISLSNQGGLISLLDDRGYKVDGVSYTKEQARREGELVFFR
ncbi:DUF2278 family protein [Myxosarcina sp. GI1]|uniref:DUF2278 family protein n=1 Tax=Myxosarcina sp. GI1 TaxID=1541065 RepID=UPI00068CE330|nr:DUF2278 family protein [Myxosarcina sp. GI1]